LRPASPFAVAVDMAAGVAGEIERGRGGGVRSEVEGVERASVHGGVQAGWRTSAGGDQDKLAQAFAGHYAGRLGRQQQASTRRDTCTTRARVR